jgi:hypothetical protein
MSIVDNYHWTPKTIENMYCDDFDFKGILYWYNELLRLDNLRNKK